MALLPLGTMIGLIALFYYLFDGSLGDGYAQLAMLTSTGVAMAIALCRRYCRWKDFTSKMSETMGNTIESLMMIVLIGVLSASWMLSGAVPTMICYGISLISPSLFIVSSCVLCSIISLVTGSSWSCIATIGVALVGIGNALGIPLGWTAGAIISGAYFGDKISPLSDTTVLASSTTETPLFTHIHYMLYTTLPSIFIACAVFTIAGFTIEVNDATTRMTLDDELRQLFNITPWALLVPIITIGLIAMRLPALITLFLSSILSCLMAVVLQPSVVSAVADGTGEWQDIARGLIMTCVDGTHLEAGSEITNSIVETSGMMGMTNTLTLILCGVVLGSSLMASGMLSSMMQKAVGWAKGRIGLVSATAGTGIMLNVSTCDQYISIIMTGSIYKDSFRQKGLETRLLSRAVEDSTTVTSVLIPWNSCGATQSAVLGISTLAYAPYCVFNYISPLMTILVAALIKPTKKAEESETSE